MNRNDFNRFISGTLVPGSGDLEGIRELTNLFPWFHSAHLVLLRGLRESSDIKFESQLKGSALYVADREVLYHYLFMNSSMEELKTAEMKDAVVAAAEPEMQELITESEPETLAEITEAEPEMLAETTESEPETLAETTESEPVMPEEEASEIVITEEEIAAGITDAGTVMAGESPAEESAGLTGLIAEETPEISEAEPETLKEINELEPETLEETTESEPETLAETNESEPETLAETTESEPETLAETNESEPVMPEEEASEIVITEEEIAAGITESEPAPDQTPETAQRSRDDLLAEIDARLMEIGEEELLELDISDDIMVTDESFADEAGADAMFSGETVSEEAVNDSPVHDEKVVEEASVDSPILGEAEVEEDDNDTSVSDETANEENDKLGPINEEPARPLSATDLIDRFIETSPRIERMKPGELHPVRDLTAENDEDHGSYITETLARIYVNQGYYTRAIIIYEKLTLQFPEKSTYFASRIEKIKELIK